MTVVSQSHVTGLTGVVDKLLVPDGTLPHDVEVPP
jgi:hypothetical protein